MEARLGESCFESGLSLLYANHFIDRMRVIHIPRYSHFAISSITRMNF